ncbi:hypothetical protein KAFR_0L01270 [Kazachstania africana CBS 2517]|uniref:RING-type E3 ubiquitin transferase n=1 Tax=Kazachstania africana (strain ATCC 22294 / BCRC 22015 / CBS 2517 / CECT 1963 / NBRC 1671 / NRRL Y-8276) TaxID=1071382 RepID=H2B286_KAZAF|nr:hypothetical protein KAFR_0L01270 [Kazachstania africana CBS 2517]CCF60736.1 hypothetical protein KAFR_0L01270 [Kazachstania africana CBS 2517]
MASSVIKEVFKVTSDAANVPFNYTLIELGVTDFSKDDVDSILLYQLTENSQLLQPFDYLNASYERYEKQRRLNKNLIASDKAISGLFENIDKLIVGYGLVTFQVEDFAINGNFTNYIKNIVTRSNDYTNFLSHIIRRAIVEDSLLEFLNNFFPVLLNYLTGQLESFDLNDSNIYNNVIEIFELFVNYKPVASIFTQINTFYPHYSCQANEFEKKTLLGPLLALSPLASNVALRNYGDNLERSKQQTKIIHESLQTEHKVVVDRLFFIMDKIIRGSLESRTGVISYWSQIVNKNHLRRGEHASQAKLASNAFMTNIALILIKFSQPFLDVSYKKIDKIDVNYFNNLNLYIDLSNETRLNSDFKEADEFYDKNKKDDENCKPNFISDCFFLTLTYLHYGIGGTILFDEKITTQIKRIKEEVERVKKVSNLNPLLNNFINLQVKNLEKSLSLTSSLKSSLQGFFSHRYIQLEIFDFVCGASTFLMRVIDPSHQFPSKAFDLPLIPDQIGFENVDNAEYLRSKAPIPFKYYPEFVVEGLINYTQSITKFANSPLFQNPRLSSFVELGTTILRCPELVSNPHLKGKLVQVLSIGALPLMDNSPGFMIPIFENNDLVRKNLLYALLDFYVIVEKTGSSSQFYDKFNARYSISIILEELYYKIPMYKKQLIWQSKNNPDFFIRFIARMLNDLTFLLDEGLTNLSEVHNVSNQLNNSTATDTNDSNIQDLQGRLAAAQRQAKSSCGLAAKSMTLFQIYTKDIPAAFASAELVDRLASMLNYNLESLVGPKCGGLKVKDPEQYSFNPKELLEALCTVYINLSDESEFISAVARDTRSFNKDLFIRAINILGKKTGLVSDDFCNALFDFARKAQERKDSEEEEDLEYGDVPDEFLDPLMYTIMKDPVTLPASRVNIDRSTIKAHLLSDSTDPFNRMPLKLEDVIPNDELKQRILEFKNGKKKEKANA